MPGQASQRWRATRWHAASSAAVLSGLVLRKQLLSCRQTDRRVEGWRGVLAAVCSKAGVCAGEQKQILSCVSGSTSHSRGSAAAMPTMLAILGPSGAGKSTLLDVLAGRPGRRTVHGRISLQGRTVRPADLRRVCGYVLQDDVFPGAPCLMSLPSPLVHS